MTFVHFVSRENDAFKVNKHVAKLSQVALSLLSEEEENEESHTPQQPSKDDEDEELVQNLNFPNVRSDVLCLVIEFMNHHVAVEEMTAIQKPLRTSSLNGIIQSWYLNFLATCQQKKTLFDLILAANFMQVEPLLDLTCAAVASLIEGKTADQLVEEFQIGIDSVPTTNLTAQQDVFTHSDLCHVLAELFVFLVIRVDNDDNYLFKLHNVSTPFKQALEYEQAAQKRMMEVCHEQLSLFHKGINTGVALEARFRLLLLTYFESLIMQGDFSGKTWPKVYTLVYELCTGRDHDINQDRIISLLPDIFALLYVRGREVSIVDRALNESKLRAYAVQGVKFIYRCFMYTERYSLPRININTIAASVFQETFEFPLVVEVTMVA